MLENPDARNARKLKRSVLSRSIALVGKRALRSKSSGLYLRGQLLTKHSKRDGLEKAVYRIEQAIKRQKSGNQSDDGQLHQLEGLLNDAQQFLPQKSPQEIEHNFQGESSSSSQQLPRINSIVQSIPGPNASDSNADDFSVHDAENPLQLLARASDLSVPTNTSNDIPRISSSLPVISRPGIVEAKDLRDFFGPFRPSLDNGEEIDPIEMGLVTQEETRDLFN